MAGVLPTPEWLAAKGWNTEAKWKECGGTRDLAHECSGCGDPERPMGREGSATTVRNMADEPRGTVAYTHLPLPTQGRGAVAEAR